MSTFQINYSQSWEDPDVLLQALALQGGDRVFSITSGGDNVLALLGANAAHVDAADINPAQNYLLELKVAAARRLDYDQYVAFLGVRDSQTRKATFELLKADLSQSAQVWWATQESLIEQGVVHSGKFERFTRFFAQSILPWIHGPRTVTALLSCASVEEQQEVYKKRWNTLLWKCMFGLATSRLLLRRFARQRGMFAHTESASVAEIYRRRLERHLSSVPIRGNYFLHYSLTGRYGAGVPPYLTHEGYERIRAAAPESLRIVHASATQYLESIPDSTFSAFNLSDIFEALTADGADQLWAQIVRTAKDGARVAFWTNLVPRDIPERFAKTLVQDAALLQQLQRRDRVFFYATFDARTIHTS